MTEQDESDNERVLEITVQSLGNLTFEANGLTVTPAPDQQTPGLYFFQISFANSGPSTLVGPMSVKYFSYTDAGDYVEWGTVAFDLNLTPNDPSIRLVAFPVDPGTYRAYALLDSADTFAETDEGDNEAFFDFTAP